MRTSLILAGALLAASPAFADEGGISFWLPGQYASLAAVPGTPGWSFSAIYFHSAADAGADEAIPKGGRIDLGVDGRGDLGVFGPSYTFDGQLWGARPTLTLLGIFGHSEGSVSGQITGPNGNTISGHLTDDITGFGDLIPQFTLAWNKGTSNYMTYVTGDIPVGAYDPSRLANLGIGHGAIDVGGGYTYFDPQNAPEFSIVTGLTFNFTNPDTHYRNGVDWHVDWGLSDFVTQQIQIGIAGYFFQQISGDSGSGATLGDFESRVAGIGPQIGYFFPVGTMQGYLNLKGYGEFAAEHRPSGWNLWLTFALTPKQGE